MVLLSVSVKSSLLRKSSGSLAMFAAVRRASFIAREAYSNSRFGPVAPTMKLVHSVCKEMDQGLTLSRFSLPSRTSSEALGLARLFRPNAQRESTGGVGIRLISWQRKSTPSLQSA